MYLNTQYVISASRDLSIKTITKDVVWWCREVAGIMGVGVFTISDENLSDVTQAEVMFTNEVLY